MVWQNYNKPSADEETEKSKFNEAGYCLSRLNELWQVCERFRTNGEMIKWNFKLDGVWIELTGDAKEDDIKGMKNINSEIVGLINKNNINLYQALMFKALFLKKLQNKQGKGTAYSDEDDGF